VFSLDALLLGFAAPCGLVFSSTGRMFVLGGAVKKEFVLVGAVKKEFVGLLSRALSMRFVDTARLILLLLLLLLLGALCEEDVDSGF
jgi:hypothetical protein